ncbi:N-acetylmuramoyl-L-alanine amidase [Gordonia sp. CPCC 205333]
MEGRFVFALKKTVVAAAAAAAAVVVAGTSAPVVNAAPLPAPVPVAGKTLAGKTVFLDPGHQGGSAGHSLTKQVPDGRGGMKDCQTSGATGVNGVPEHKINWEVAQLVKAGLESQGARVVLSRPNDTGWGGCVDERAAAASKSGAAVAVSLHADSTSGGADTSKKGFHMIVPTLPLSNSQAQQAQSGGGRKASTLMRDAFKKAGFAPANYAGVADGIQTRSDIAGVNLTTVPAVFIEMGNLSNPTEASALSDKAGQLKYATAITDGILGYAAGAGVSTTSLPSTGSLGSTPSDAPTSTPNADIDADGLAGVFPLIQQLLATRDPQALMALIAGPGQDVGSQVLKAMLSVVYSLFGGKLPVG